MHFAERAYALIVLIAVLAIAGTWAEDPLLAGLWRLPTALLLLGLALEGWSLRQTGVSAALETSGTLLLGTARAGAFVLRNSGARDVVLEYAPATPPGIESLGEPRRIRVPQQGQARDEVALLPVRLGRQVWPALPARLLGRLGLAWWSRELPLAQELVVAPDALRSGRLRSSGLLSGRRVRSIIGAGSELHQLRPYVPGDPPARVDWKASARCGSLITREFSEDQHLDILIAVDAGRRSRVRTGRLDRLGLYANIAARFAQYAVTQDDRVGLCVFSDRPLVVLAPDRGTAAVIRLRHALERLDARAAESDPVAAAMRIRALLRHRTLVVLLTDLEDTTLAEDLARAQSLLTPPHLALIAGVRGPEIGALARAPARSWRDPWIALAASEHELRSDAHLARLRRLGAPVIAAREDLLERAVFAEYEALRRRRRI
ncbi:MAG TPA: DUF58 domain-containing protein [Steroidobacteraceae bacterium]